MSTAATQSEQVKSFLQMLIQHGGFDLRFKITLGGGKPPKGASAKGSGRKSAESAAAPESISAPEIAVEFFGSDVSLLLAHNGELLLALEYIAAKILRFEQHEHHRISFDADNFKILRQQELRMAAQVAVERVRSTGKPFSFAPMTSRERRILHMELASSGLATASTGEGSRRYVVLYPENVTPQTPTEVRSAAIRNTFRRR